MKTLLTRTNVAWLLTVAMVCGALLVIWMVATKDAPPSGAVLIQTRDSTASDLLSPATPTPAEQSEAQPTGAGLAGTSSGGLRGTSSGAALGAGSGSLNPEVTPTEARIWVYVSGAVAKPGVYNLPEGARVDAALSAAGGALPDADLDALNLAQRLLDEDHIAVPRKGEASASATDQPIQRPTRPPVSQQTGGQPRPTSAGLLDGKKLNINTATAAELEQLPGIGPALAQKILDDRQQNGPLSSTDDLTRIPGIKGGILSKIEPYIMVGP
jgi:competence protein ComEA